MSCEACASGGLNVTAALTIPGTDNTDGPSVDVSGMVGCKTIELAGDYEGKIIILGSHNNLNFVPVAVFNSGNGIQSAKLTLNYVLRFMRARRRAQFGTGLSAVIGSQATCECVS